MLSLPSPQQPLIEALNIVEELIYTLERESTITETLYMREAAQESLLEFTRQAWHVIEGPGRPFHTNWHIEALCEHLEAVYNGQIKNLLCNFPPRTCKSTIISVMFPAWVWLRRPETQFMCIANNSRLVAKAATKSRDIIRSSWYQSNWGEIYRLKMDEDSKLLFKNDKTGYRASFGMGSGITGDGGEFIIIDDPNNTEESDVERENIIDTWNGTISTRQNVESFGGIILMQQRTHEMDLTGYLLQTEADNWVKFILPMEYDPKRAAKTISLPSSAPKVWRDPRKKEGELLWPDFRTKKWVDTLKIRLGNQYRISGQLQQSPSPAEGGMIKKAWFPLWKEGKPPKMLQIIQSWDTALSGAKGTKSDEDLGYSACTTYGLFKGKDDLYNLILLGLWRGKVEYPELRERAIKLYRDYRDDGETIIEKETGYRPSLVLIETKASGSPLIADLRKAGIRATGFNPTKYGDKLNRVRLVSHYLEAGVVYLPTLAPDFTRPRRFADLFVNQVATFPKGESRDIVDTLTQVLLRMTSTGWVKDKRDPDDELTGGMNVNPQGWYGATDT